MENLFQQDISPQELRKKWALYHPDNNVLAVGQGNNGKNTVLSKKIDKALVQYVSYFSRVMIAGSD